MRISSGRLETTIQAEENLLSQLESRRSDYGRYLVTFPISGGGDGWCHARPRQARDLLRELLVAATMREGKGYPIQQEAGSTDADLQRRPYAWRGESMRIWRSTVATRITTDRRKERKSELEVASEAMEAAVLKYVAAELAAADGSCPDTDPALVDERIRRFIIEASRRGMEAALSRGNGPGTEG